MISLFAALGGFISSLLPEILKLFRERDNKKHELALFDKQIEVQKLNLDQKFEENSHKADVDSLKIAYQTYKTNIGIIDALNGAVRPLLAYSFFIIYSLTKYFCYKTILVGAPAFIYLETIWTSEDQAIFAGIISFYFGQRSLNRRK